MALPSIAPDTVTGTVAHVNPKGIKLTGYTEWLNFSKFADVVPPSRGDVVTVRFDRAGFIRSCLPADGAEPRPAPSLAHTATSSHKDRTITRLACLKAAADFGATRSQLKSGDILTIAASWERWILRDDDAFATEELP